MQIRQILAAAAACVFSFGTAQALTIEQSQTESINFSKTTDLGPYDLTDYNPTTRQKSFIQFDPTLGTLTSARMELTSKYDQRFFVMYAQILTTPPGTFGGTTTQQSAFSVHSTLVSFSDRFQTSSAQLSNSCTHCAPAAIW